MRRWLIFAFLAVLCGAAPAAAQGIIPLEGSVPDAAAAHITPDGLEFISEVASDALGAFDLETLLMAMNPLVSITNCGGLIFEGDININSVSLDHLQFQLSSTPIMGMSPIANGLYARIAAYPVAGQSLLVLGIDGAWGLGCTDPFNATAALDTDPLEIGISLTIDYTPGAKGMEAVLHEVVLGNDTLSVTFTGLPDPSLEPLLELLIEEMAGPLIEDLAPALINEALAEALADIVLEGESAVGDYTLVYAFDPAFETDGQGLTVITDGSLYLEGTTVDTCLEPPFPIGSPYTAGAMPDFGVLTPGGDPFDMALVFSDDMFNQLIYSFLIKGDLCLMFPFDFDRPLTLADFAGLAPDVPLPPERADDTYLIDIYPVDLPTIVVGEGGTDLALVADPLRLDWYLLVEDRYVAMLTADITLNLGLLLDVDDDNNLIISLDEEQSTIHFRVDGTEWNLLPPALIENLLNGLIDNFLLPLIGGILPPVPLPSFGGYQFVIHEIGATGVSQDFFGLYTEFVDVPPVAAAAFDLPGRGVVKNAELNARQSARAHLAGPTAAPVRLANNDVRRPDYHRVRFDGGVWRVVRDAEVDLSRLLDGPHVLEVVAVRDGRAQSESPARLAFVLDRVAPRIDKARVTDGLLEVAAHDYVATPQQLFVQARAANGLWSRWSRLGKQPLPTGALQAWQVRVADPSGNVSPPRWIGRPELAPTFAP
jgi:hypothetical protein